MKAAALNKVDASDSGELAWHWLRAFPKRILVRDLSGLPTNRELTGRLATSGPYLIDAGELLE